MFPQAARMLPAVAKSRMQIHRGHRPVVAPFTVDPVPAMRRELKLLRIEVEQLRAVERMIGRRQACRSARRAMGATTASLASIASGRPEVLGRGS